MHHLESLNNQNFIIIDTHSLKPLNLYAVYVKGIMEKNKKVQVMNKGLSREASVSFIAKN